MLAKRMPQPNPQSRKRGHVFHDRGARRRQAEAYQACPVKPLRTWADMTDEERAVIQAKACRVLNEHRGLNITPFPADANGGVGF